MEKIKLPIIIATIYLAIYVVTASYDTTTRLTIFLFSLSPLPVIWMVWRVLHDGTPSPYTFEERFYEDYDYTPVPESVSAEDR
jgi:hypothetical protein